MPSGEEKKEYVLGIFTSISHKYDLINSLLSLMVDHYWRWRTARLLRNIPEGPILDLCAGTMPLSLELARQAENRLVFAMDFCERMLRTGMKKLPDDHCRPRIFPICGDGEAIPAPADTFCACTVAFGVRNMVNTRQGLSEIYRVLLPGGILLILELSRPTNVIIKPVYNFYLYYMLPWIASICAKNRDAYEYLAQSIASFYEPDELIAMMWEAGFTKVECRKLTFGVVSIYMGIK
ncbi:MAG: ubiquinone/menaquinone biosynthesis methyltransferase [Candidatus Electrothrix sp. MAN1_4]|nr:ubiquinone/menaquinone biosynthesis methyltransferase [Candidatus Electrothrix sp. MAN1_4]